MSLPILFSLLEELFLPRLHLCNIYVSFKDHLFQVKLAPITNQKRFNINTFYYSGTKNILWTGMYHNDHYNVSFSMEMFLIINQWFILLWFSYLLPENLRLKKHPTLCPFRALCRPSTLFPVHILPWKTCSGRLRNITLTGVLHLFCPSLCHFPQMVYRSRPPLVWRANNSGRKWSPRKGQQLAGGYIGIMWGW